MTEGMCGTTVILGFLPSSIIIFVGRLCLNFLFNIGSRLLILSKRKWNKKWRSSWPDYKSLKKYQKKLYK
jgi:hypothetical protein